MSTDALSIISNCHKADGVIESDFPISLTGLAEEREMHENMSFFARARQPDGNYLNKDQSVFNSKFYSDEKSIPGSPVIMANLCRKLSMTGFEKSDTMVFDELITERFYHGAYWCRDRFYIYNYIQPVLFNVPLKYLTEDVLNQFLSILSAQSLAKSTRAPN